MIRTTENHPYNRSDILLTVAIFLLAATAYCLLSPGRIDIVDSQFRFEVAYNLIHHHSVSIRDAALAQLGPPGKDGLLYSLYGLSGSIAGLPLIALAELLTPGNRDAAQFLFSFTSAGFGAGTLALLYSIYRSFNINPTPALAWTLIFGFATLFLPLTASTFDQTQNAFFILAAFYWSDRARVTRRIKDTLLGGAAFVALIHYKEAYIVLWPGLLYVAGWRSSEPVLAQVRRDPVLRALILAGFAALASWAAYNLGRFGSVTIPAGQGYHPPYLGNNPVVGLLGLTISPGKGLLWYSPAMILPLLGWRNFNSAHPVLSKGILLASAAWILLISALTFYGGDWCWGPRYWIPILPLLFLAAPFHGRLRMPHKAAASLLIACSMVIQGMSVAVDHQKFFFSHGLPPHFWYSDKNFYFRHSALLERPREIAALVARDSKLAPTGFRPGPYPELLTYSIFGPGSAQELHDGEQWMSRYPVFTLPRPWPLWSAAIDDASLARARLLALSALSAIGLLGLFLGSVGWISRRKHQPHTADISECRPRLD